MSDQSQGPGWWVASDGRWYPPQEDPPTGPAEAPAPFDPRPMAVPDPQRYAVPHLPPVPPAGPHWNTPLPVGASVRVRSSRRPSAWVVIGASLLVVGVLVALLLTRVG